MLVTRLTHFFCDGIPKHRLRWASNSDNPRSKNDLRSFAILLRMFLPSTDWYDIINFFPFLSLFSYIFFVMSSLRLYCLLVLLHLFPVFSPFLISISFYLLLAFFFYYCLLFSSILLIYLPFFYDICWFVSLVLSINFYYLSPFFSLSHHSNWISCLLFYIPRHIL